jgi:hypothetical protein
LAIGNPDSDFVFDFSPAWLHMRSRSERAKRLRQGTARSIRVNEGATGNGAGAGRQKKGVAKDESLVPLFPAPLEHRPALKRLDKFFVQKK